MYTTISHSVVSVWVDGRKYLTFFSDVNKLCAEENTPTQFPSCSAQITRGTPYKCQGQNACLQGFAAYLFSSSIFGNWETGSTALMPPYQSFAPTPLLFAAFHSCFFRSREFRHHRHHHCEFRQLLLEMSPKSCSDLHLCMRVSHLRRHRARVTDCIVA